MKEVPLTQGRVALVDDEDWEMVSRHSWSLSRGMGGHLYARARIRTKLVAMHRLLMGVADSRVFVDHINGNGLDNRRANLRIATRGQNNANSRFHSNNTSGFRGVARDGRNWRAVITHNGKPRHIGTFATRHDAALAYDAKARELHGEFARLNFPV